LKSTIFFRNFTNLDHGYIDDKGMIHGGSLLLSCYMTGTPTLDESVVLDFSMGKKQLKQIVDDRYTGLDHKLLLFKDSNYEIEHYVDEFEIDRVKLKTPCIEADFPKDAIQEIENYGAIELLINQEMTKLYPDFDLTCKIEMSTQGYTNLNAKYFNYSHGLKSSTSFGCKCAAHGHLSFVEVFANCQGIDIYNTRLAEEIADHMNDAVFVYNMNITGQTNETLTIAYETPERGKMSIMYCKPQKIIVLNTETTIEYIIEYIKTTYAQQLRGKTLRISEGLQKGAQIEIEL
jgi:6-pyruvoyl-tetrahydropterin synthase